ncbi:MAG: tetratricopeptide repeat protein [Chitinivibrionales bacterium]|nr:tetratricopeptide repeat protein [Chitinivibrionales bacterium]
MINTTYSAINRCIKPGLAGVNPLLVAIAIGLVVSLLGCASKTFPVVRPVDKIGRGQMARLRAQDYFIKGRDYDRRGLDQMAEHFYEMAYELDPQSQVLRKLLASKYVASGKYSRALLIIKGRRELEELAPGEQKTIAHLYMKMGQYARAAAILEKQPNLSGMEWRSLGLIYEALGNWDKAVHSYRKYAVQTGGSFEIGMKIAELYRRRGRFAKAESLLVALDSVYDEHGVILNALGGLMLAKGDTGKAIDFYKAAVTADSTNHEAMRNLAQVFIQNGEFDKAVKYYEEMYRGGEMVELYGRTLALLYYYNKQYDKAERLIKKLLSTSPADYELHYYLGLISTAQENFDLAVLELEKAVAGKPDFLQAWQSLCYVDIKRKHWDRALACARRFVERMDESAAAWRLLGYVHNAQKDHEKARGALERATTLDSLDTQAWFELGSVYERQGDHERAANAFGTVLRLDPNNHEAANYLGYMWAERGINLDSAKQLLELALEHRPENGAYLDSYAWIFYKLGDADNALKYIRQAVENLNDDPVIYDHYGDILAENGRVMDAIQAYHTSLELGFDLPELIEKKIRTLREQAGIAAPKEAHQQR